MKCNDILIKLHKKPTFLVSLEFENEKGRLVVFFVFVFMDCNLSLSEQRIHNSGYSC